MIIPTTRACRSYERRKGAERGRGGLEIIVTGLNEASLCIRLDGDFWGGNGGVALHTLTDRSTACMLCGLYRELGSIVCVCACRYVAHAVTRNVH